MPRARRAAALLLVLSLFPAAAAGVTSYDIRLDGDTAHVTTEFELYPGPGTDRTTRMSASWSLPDGATLQSIRDSDGPITDYTVDGDTVRFDTEITPGEGKEVITVEARVDGVVDASYNGLDRVSLQLAGFSDKRSDVPEEVTQVRLSTRRDLLAETHSFGFRIALGSHGANLTGEGPVNLHLAVSDQGRSYEHFRLFGAGNLSRADRLYWVASGVTGIRPPVNTHPVIVLPDDRYERELDPWSAGQYRTGGLIFLKQSTMDSDEAAAVTLHEVVHAYNDHALRWSATDRAWFDEGVAKYTEFLIKQRQGLHQAEIFGDRVSWQCGQRRTCYYEPRGTPDQLWQYYAEGQDWMRTWTPRTARTAEQRTFGYAFSELMIRNYVRNRGDDALHPVYDRMQQIDAPVRDTRASTDRLLQLMDTDFTPCRRSTRAAFDSCLDAVNAMAPGIPDPVGGTVERVDIQPIQQPNETGVRTGLPGGNPLARLLSALAAGINRLLAALAQVF